MFNQKGGAYFGQEKKNACYISLGGENAVVLGCDFDGITATPEGLGDISSLPRLYEALAERLGENTAKRVFSLNALDFIKRNIPK